MGGGLPTTESASVSATAMHCEAFKTNAVHGIIPMGVPLNRLSSVLEHGDWASERHPTFAFRRPFSVESPVDAWNADCSNWMCSKGTANTTQGLELGDFETLGDADAESDGPAMIGPVMIGPA